MTETPEQKQLRDLAWALARAWGIVWLIKRIPGYRLKPWMQDREDSPPMRLRRWPWER